ncbi:MAG TPA: PIN domain-containing protein [Saliniramus sp.]|nr:PIN domain-containing protein [Saliniramus sp.]
MSQHSGAIRTYLDSNALIRLVESVDDDMLYLLQQVATGAVRAVTSEVALAEVLVKPMKDDDSRIIADYDALFQDDEFLEVVPVTREVLRRSAASRASIGNKGMDAIHVATAEVAECAIFLSSDLRLRLPQTLTRLRLDQIRGNP